MCLDIYIKHASYTALSHPHQGKTMAVGRSGARWVAFGVKKRKREEWKNRFKSLEGCSYLANVRRPEIDTANAKKEDF